MNKLIKYKMKGEFLQHLLKLAKYLHLVCNVQLVRI